MTSTAQEGARDVISRHHDMGGTCVGLPDPSVGRDVPGAVATQAPPRGAVADNYQVPSAQFRRSSPVLAVIVGGVTVAALAARHIDWIVRHPLHRALLIAWLAGTVLVLAQWLMSWLDRPVPQTDRQRRRLDRLKVVVNVPVFNEDPAILDRVLWALTAQTRPPDVIDVVDDCSAVDYTSLRAHWEGWHGPIEVRWHRIPKNQGKKVAQCQTFSGYPYADIFVTVDSDSTLERHALERGLAPFTDPSVQSVAGMELAWNARANWLTQTVYARTLFFQVVVCGAQSWLGDVLVNRGPFALYRADLIRRIVPAYLGEMFLGRHVKLGDDAALTLFARGAGRAVQQSDAFAYSMFPEKLSHHLRQWLRWMRGSTIRNCWRIKYLPLWSYGWWFTLLNIHLFLVACAVPFAIAASWPASASVGEWIIAAMGPWTLLSGTRILSVRRSDETWAIRLGTLASYPAAILWLLAVLRWMRLWGIVTCLRQGWNTRQGGAEQLTVALTSVAGD